MRSYQKAPTAILMQFFILFNKKMFEMNGIFSLPESILETCGVVLTFESVDEILWCDHSNEISSAVLLLGSICFSIFDKMKFGITLEF